MTPGFITRPGSQMSFISASSAQPVGAVHPAEQFRARPPVAVLAGNGAAEGDHQIGCLLDEFAVGREPGAG